jgi:hypothetical protein
MDFKIILVYILSHLLPVTLYCETVALKANLLKLPNGPADHESSYGGGRGETGFTTAR